MLCSRKFSFVNFYFQEDEKVEKKAEALDHSVDLEGNLEDLGGVDSGANVEAERLARRVSVPDELENETEAFDPFGQETEPEVVVKRGRILEPKYVGKSEGKKKNGNGVSKSRYTSELHKPQHRNTSSNKDAHRGGGRGRVR